MKRKTEAVMKIADEMIQQQINAENWELPLDTLSELMKSLHSQLIKLREMARETEMNEEEEIYFFKVAKPKILSKFLYFKKVYTIEIEQPYGGYNEQIAYYQEYLQSIQDFSKKNISFIRYHRSKSTHLDTHYFIRRLSGLQMDMDKIPLNVEPEFSTFYDYELAKIKANDMLVKYLNKKIAKVEKEKSNEYQGIVDKKPSFTWTDTKIAAIELAYALYATGSLNNGNAEIKEIMNFIATSFKIDLGDYYRSYLSLKNRKKDRTSYMKSLMDNLIKKMDEEDGV